MGELEWWFVYVVVHIVDDVLGLRAFPGDGGVWVAPEHVKI